MPGSVRARALGHAMATSQAHAQQVMAQAYDEVSRLPTVLEQVQRALVYAGLEDTSRLLPSRSNGLGNSASTGMRGRAAVSSSWCTAPSLDAALPSLSIGSDQPPSFLGRSMGPGNARAADTR